MKDNRLCIFITVFFVLCNCFWKAYGQELTLTINLAHSFDVSSVEYSPDGKYLVSGSPGQGVKIWEVSTGKLIRTLQSDTSFVFTVSVSPNGKYIASGRDDGSIKIWDASSGRLFKTLYGHSDGINTINYSPDGKYLASGSADKSIKIWDASSGRLFKTLHSHSDGINTINYSPDGKFLASGSADKSIKIWDTSSGRLFKTLYSHSDGINTINYSPDGKFLASGSADKSIKIWDITSGKLLRTIQGHDYSISTVDYSPDGAFLASGSYHAFSHSGPTTSRSIKVWDMKTGKLVKTLEDFSDGVTSITYSPDGKYLASGNTDKSVKIWDIVSGKLVTKIQGHDYSISTVDYSPDGKYLASGNDDGNIKIWNIASGKLLRTMQSNIYYPINTIKHSPDGKYLASGSGDGSIKIWEIPSGKLIQSLKAHSDKINTISYSPKGKYLASGSDDGNIKIWKFPSGRLIQTLTTNYDWIQTLNFSPNGKYLLSGDFLGKLKTWEVATGKLIQTLKSHSDRVVSVNYSPDGKYITTGSHKNIKIWEVSTGKLIRTLQDHFNGITSIKYSPDGKYLASGGWDQNIKIWEISTGKLIRTLQGHSGWISEITYSPDGKYLASGSFDQSIKIWNLQTGKELLTLISFPDEGYVITTPEDLFDGNDVGFKNLHYVKGMEIIGLNQLKERYYEPDLMSKLFGYSDEPIRNVEVFKDIALYPEVALSLKGNQLKVNLIERSGGIGKVSLYLANKELVPDINPTRQTSFAINLMEYRDFFSSGDQLIRVKAYNDEGWLPSSFSEIKFTPQTKIVTKRPTPRFIGIVIGTHNYRGERLDLKYAAEDANEVAHVFEKSAQAYLNAANVSMYLYTTDLTHKDKLKSWEGLPSKTNIQGVFERVSKEAQPEDVLFMYFSGHGVNYGGQDGQFYYLTKDVESGDLSDSEIRKQYTISTDELIEMIKKVPAQKQVLILDACASGKVIDIFVKKEIPSSQRRSLDRLQSRTGMFILAGSTADKASYEANRYGQGLLTYSILEALKGTALREDMYVDVLKMMSYSKERVPIMAEGFGGIQEPVIEAPDGISSFDIGKVTSEIKDGINIITPKPYFRKTNFQNETTYIDDLGLGTMVNHKLNDLSLEGKNATAIYIDVENYTEAYGINGRYTIKDGRINIEGKVFFGDQALGDFNVQGEISKKEELVENIIDTAFHYVNK